MEELSFLREFVDLAQTCNFLDTAENMNISASTLSKHIRKLEEEVGVPLFERTTRSVRLNEYGVILKKYADKIIALLNEFDVELNSAKASLESILNVGYLPMISRYNILETLSEFSAIHPEICVKAKESFHLSEELQNCQMDIIFVDSLSCPKIPGAKSLPFKTDHMVAVIPSSHPLASNEYVTIEELAQEKEILLHVSSDGKLTLTSQRFLNECKKRGYNVTYTFSSYYITTLLRMVSNGDGISIMNSAELYGTDYSDCVAVAIHPEITFTYIAEYINNQTHMKAKSLFCKYLQTLNDQS